MNHNVNQPYRQSTRLKGYDYSASGWYFVTICVHNHACIFGDVTNGKMELNRNCQIVQTEWLKTPKIRLNVDLDEFVVMPNHLHGILVIEYSTLKDNQEDGRGVKRYAPTTGKSNLKTPSQTIGSIVRGFKCVVTKQINEIRKTPGKPVWQRNYYEHISRNDKELFNIRQYIINNPLKWDLDKENPKNREF